MKDIILLAGCWAMALTASTLITACGPLAAESVGAPTAIAPFTIGAFLFGAAIVSAPSDRMFSRWGRRGGFFVGIAFGGFGGIVGVIAILLRCWPLVLFACFCLGISQGVAQFLRFAATDLCTKVEERSRAVTLVLAGGIIAAFAGPQAAVHSRTLKPFLNPQYAGCFALVVLANALNLVLLLLVRFADDQVKHETLTEAMLPENQEGQPDKIIPPRATLEILSQPRCACAVCVAALAHTAMVMLMSPLTLAMNHYYSYQLTSLTLELHFLSMYLPGLLGTSTIIKTFGPYATSGFGLIVFAASAITLVSGQTLWQFIVGMSLCGIAWNLTFSAGTVLLTTCYTSDEALRVQAVNDLVIFGLAGTGSFASGYIYVALSWKHLVLVVSGIMALFAFILAASLYLQIYSSESAFLQSRRKKHPPLNPSSSSTLLENDSSSTYSPLPPSPDADNAAADNNTEDDEGETSSQPV